MKTVVNGVFVICVLISCTIPSFSDELSASTNLRTIASAQLKKSKNIAHEKLHRGRSLDYNRENEEEEEDDEQQQQNNIEQRQLQQKEHANQLNLAKKSKPLRNIFMGIYKNYKSTYLGNKTLTEYKQSLRENLQNKQNQQQQLEMEVQEAEDDSVQDSPNVNDTESHDEDDSDEETEIIELGENSTASADGQKTEDTEEITLKPKLSTKGKPEQPEQQLPPLISKEQEYSMGEALNISLDVQNSLVKVNLDGESLRELVTGRWLNDNTEEGRGKKYEMVTRIMPLFILPFLIQSAIVPFLVTKLKLLIVKSMLVGKLAIFLLIISAFKNSNKMMQSYEVAPYWASEPSRRSELAASASNMAYNGYRVEGKPAAWIN